MRDTAGPLPILAAALAMFLLSIMDGFIKAAAPDFATSVIVLMRFAFGGLVAIGIYLALGRPAMTGEAFRYGLLRGVLTVVTASMFFAALGRLPLVEVIALSFIAPILMALLGRIFLKEAVGRSVVAGLALGTAGLLVMVALPLWQVRHEAIDATGILLVMGANLTYATGMVLLRARAAKDPLPVIVLLQNWVPALLIAPVAVATWTTPAPVHWAMFATIGALGAAGHVLLTWAFARATAARVGVVEYTVIVWAAIIGYVFFAEVPGLATLAGAVLIVLGAWMVG
jgi:drug/metabolite transporter (DMT)-like permease